MKNRIPHEELIALTPATWAAWYQEQSESLRAGIMLAVDRLQVEGLTARQAMVSVYALIESAKLDELDRLYNLPHTVN
jgi:predicted hotdog family 3-hydroxylacyl-ACP dehydratase